MTDLNSMAWAERHRPKTIDECILPKSIKRQAKGLVTSGNLPSLLFVGGAGCGKTTLAMAMANEIGADFMKINASLEGNIDMIRTKLSQFASTVSFTDSKKLTLLDEADGLTPQAQNALRGFVEEFSDNHSIIFTGNYAAKIIEPIKSRCSIIDFKIPKEEKVELSTQFMRRILNILDIENIKYEQLAVANLVTKKFPDFRSVLNELQGYSAGSGVIDAGILLNLSDEAFMRLIKALKERKYNECRRWVAENYDIETEQFYKMFYDKASEVLQPQSIPELVDIIATKWYEGSFISNPEIRIMGFLNKLLMSDGIQWK